MLFFLQDTSTEFLTVTQHSLCFLLITGTFLDFSLFLNSFLTLQFSAFFFFLKENMKAENKTRQQYLQWNSKDFFIPLTLHAVTDISDCATLRVWAHSYTHYYDMGKFCRYPYLSMCSTDPQTASRNTGIHYPSNSFAIFCSLHVFLFNQFHYTFPYSAKVTNILFIPRENYHTFIWVK